MAYINVDVDLDKFEDNDLITELVHRGYSVSQMKRKPNSFEEVMELFMTKNPKVSMIDTIELENHMKEILHRS